MVTSLEDRSIFCLNWTSPFEWTWISTRVTDSGSSGWSLLKISVALSANPIWIFLPTSLGLIFSKNFLSGNYKEKSIKNHKEPVTLRR